MIVLRTLGFLLAAFAVLSHSSVLLAQSTWRQRLSQQGAPPRTFMAICYDSARRETVVFGGMFPGGGGGGGGTPLNETWSWDGILWRQQHPGGSPSARFGSAMAFDAVRQEAVLFGGLDQTNIPMGDTWIWDGSTWTQRNPVSSPPPMLAHAMVYDAARDEVVLFGGVGGPTPHNMTWVWDGSTWTRRFPANSPPLRCFHAMVYDTARQETVLFGGSAQTQDPGLPLGDTWCWNGTDWSQRFPGNAPSARFFHQMAFYGPDSSVLLHGGSGNAGPMSDTWLWNGSTWTKPPSYVSPGPRMMGGMAYDSARSEAVLYSGTGQGGPVFDTWVYQACHNIVRQPGSQTVLSGLSATLSVRDDALGPVAYQWYEGSSGDASHPIEGATTDTYTTPPLTSDTNYWVRLENVCSSIDSATAVISVTSFCVPPSISPQPDDQVIQPGASATLWITANGSSPLTY